MKTTVGTPITANHQATRPVVPAGSARSSSTTNAIHTAITAGATTMPTATVRAMAGRERQRLGSLVGALVALVRSAVGGCAGPFLLSGS